MFQGLQISVDNWIKGGLGPTISKTQSLQTITQSIQTQNTIRGDQSAIQQDQITIHWDQITIQWDQITIHDDRQKQTFLQNANND